MQEYFSELDKKLKIAYDVANNARSKGYDPEDKVEIPLARDMAENDARGRAAQYLFKPKIVKNKDGSTKQIFSGFLRNFLCGKYEFITVRDKEGRQGFVAETLCETPLNNYKK